MDVDPVLTSALLGDRRALDELCQREWRPVYGMIYRTVQNQADAQDLTQEVFLRAFNSLGRYQVTGSPFRVYLITIARNLLRDRWKAARFSTSDIDEQFDLASPEPGPEPLALASIGLDEINRAVEQLPEEYQIVIRLRVVEGRPSPEVARIMGRNPDAIRQLQRRALAALRVALERMIPV
jgi:RNA polymerase sigma-70 factor, ECF subfamily